jgi:hypothetical protein
MSFTLFSLVLIVGMVLLGGGIGLIFLLIQLGVIVHEAQRPPHQDAGNYEISKGHEVRSELEHPAEVHSSREQ